MFAKEETHDLYSAIDLAVDKLEHQAQKLKAKRQEPQGRDRARASATPAEVDDLGAAPTPRPAGAPEVIRSQRVPAKPMSVDEAVEQLDAARATSSSSSPNAANQTLAVLYRRKDGSYGLIEPEALELEP